MLIACTITARLAHGRAVPAARTPTRAAVLLQDRLDDLAATTRAMLDGTAVFAWDVPVNLALAGIDLHAREMARRATRTALLTPGTFWRT